MKKAILALGSNIGNRREYLVRAITELEDAAHVFARSKIYETKPWGFLDQRDFLNAAVAVETDCAPLELLEFCKHIERKLGRVSTVKNGPRQIDIDIIFFGSGSFSDPTLTIPHPRWSERGFVISPLLDLLDTGVFADESFCVFADILKSLERMRAPFSAF